MSALKAEDLIPKELAQSFKEFLLSVPEGTSHKEIATRARWYFAQLSDEFIVKAIREAASNITDDQIVTTIRDSLKQVSDEMLMHVMLHVAQTTKDDTK